MMTTTNDVEFHKQHKASGFVYVSASDTTLYGDGSWLSGRGMGSVMFTPRTEMERAKSVVRYWEAKTANAIDAFDQLKHQLVDAARCVQRDAANIELDPQAINLLDKLAKDVTKCRAELEKAKVAANESVPDWIKTRSAEQDERRRKAAEYLEKVKSITI